MRVGSFLPSSLGAIRLRILFFGDIIGKPGRDSVARFISSITGREDIDFIIANGENAAGGLGLTPDIASEILDSGVQVITTGNHVWNKREMVESIDDERYVLRPANYPRSVPGRGHCVVSSNGYRLGVISLQGRVFMTPIDCPFEVGTRVAQDLRASVDAIFVDFHAEATSEKQALGHHLDGTVSAVCGTHTHVQTSDERILPRGTAYITDVGMCGPMDSVIGMRVDTVVPRFLTGLPSRFEVAGGPVMINAVLVELDHGTGKARSIQRISQV